MNVLARTGGSAVPLIRSLRVAKRRSNLILNLSFRPFFLSFRPREIISYLMGEKSYPSRSAQNKEKIPRSPHSLGMTRRAVIVSRYREIWLDSSQEFIPTTEFTLSLSNVLRTSSEDGDGFGVTEDSSVATLPRNDKRAVISTPQPSRNPQLF